jgi:predicted aconitase with swiveling domain
MMRDKMNAFGATTLSAGQASGSPLLLKEPLSFWGGLDSTSGRIIDRWHPQHGQIISGTILLMDAGRGSSSGSSVLAESIRLGTGPAGIILLTRDAIVTVGAMVASELYGKACPVVLASADDWPSLIAADFLSIAANEQSATISTRGSSGEPAQKRS